ncbi:DUF1992 domain-containing protein [Bacillus salitolerans]|uniref:DUF1992 domain-containing protein n=1 Tax=Bacillus salitolerans TaxID=1437434 RepID=A0ABW4LUD2_9BACI
MKKDEIGSREKAKNIMMSDQSTSNFTWFYEDHITSIVRRAEKEGQFDEIKGKELNTDYDLSYNPDKQLNKVLKDNEVLPRWVELGREIDRLKSDLAFYKDEYNIKRTIQAINKKVMDYNLCAPRTSQKAGIHLESYLNKILGR